jgi:hypothetical protein
MTDDNKDLTGQPNQPDIPGPEAERQEPAPATRQSGFLLAGFFRQGTDAIVTTMGQIGQLLSKLPGAGARLIQQAPLAAPIAAGIVIATIASAIAYTAIPPGPPGTSPSIAQPPSNSSTLTPTPPGGGAVSTPTSTASGSAPGHGGAESTIGPGGGPNNNGTNNNGTNNNGTNNNGTNNNGTNNNGTNNNGTNNNGTNNNGPGTLTWGFARDRYPTQPVGSTHDLSVNNPEANWTYGLWRLVSPPPAGKPTATHLAIGSHRIRLPGIGTPGGIVHVMALDPTTGVFCQPLTWGQDAADEIINVACFDPAGNAADVPFGVLFLAFLARPTNNPLSAGGSRGYVFNDQPMVTFTPDQLHSLNTGTVSRTGAGHYTVDLPGSTGGVIEISAVGAAPRHCAVANRSGDLVDVVCVAHGTGAALDTPFTISYAVAQNLLDDRRKPVGDYLISTDSPSSAAPSIIGTWASNNSAATLTRSTVGKYAIHFSNGQLPSTIQVTKTGTIGYCNLNFWNDIGSNNTNIWVNCFTPNGTPTNSGFELLHTSTRT